MDARIAAIWYEEGQSQFSSGQIEKAIDSFRKATTDALRDRTYALALANALAEGNHDAEAQQTLLRLREGDPEDAEINSQLARLAAKRGEVDDAVHYYQNALYGRWAGTQVDQRKLQLRVELIRFLLVHQQRDVHFPSCSFWMLTSRDRRSPTWRRRASSYRQGTRSTL